jgi:protein SCO1/2
MFALVAVLTTACAAPSSARGSFDGVELAQATPKPEFVLTDTTGHLFDFGEETEGRLTFLYFGYTHCPDICPVHLAQLSAVFDQLPEVRRNSAVVFVTVDPERDDPATIRRFLDVFSEDFIGLTGAAEQLEAAQTAAGVPVALKEGAGSDYTMGHAGQVLVYAPDGMGYTVYPFGTRQSEWIHDLPMLLERR